jgi:hypothetical protein
MFQLETNPCEKDENNRLAKGKHMPQEIDKFFEDLPTEDKKVADIFEDKKPTEEAGKTEEKPEEGETEEQKEVRLNRRERRLQAKLQAERESNIALNERLKTLAEVEKTVKETAGEIDPRLIRVFGTSDEAKEVARHFTEILAETKESAREEALREIEQRQIGIQEEQKEYESFIDSQLESLEDQHNIDLTSDSVQARKTRREFLEMVEQLSPKDSDGTITDYADFGSTFDIYQKTHQEPKVDNSRQKEVASKSMQRSAQNGSSESQRTPGFRGWEKDLGINN